MLDARIIEPIEELEWIIPIVIQDTKTTREVVIYIDLRKLNDAFLHDPFPTPFIDEVLESVGGKEMYLFTYNFYSYHQVKITKEDHHKMAFIIEWVCYIYGNALWTQECTYYFL